MKKLIVLLAFILPFSCYCQEVYLLRTTQSQKEFTIQRCGYQETFKSKDNKYVIKLRYDREQNQLFYAFYEEIYPPYDGKSLFNNQGKERAISENSLKVKNLTIQQILNSPICAGRIFSTDLSYQQQWNDGVSWSFLKPYELSGDGTGDNIPTFSFKKKQ